MRFIKKRSMKIKKIAKVKDKPFYNVETDEGNFKVIGLLVGKYFLVSGLNISLELMKKIEEESKFELAFRRALIYLSYRKRSKKEIENKLRFLKYNDLIISMVVNKLIENNYLSEFDYAKSYAVDVLNLKGYGKNFIYCALRSQKIDEEVIKKVIGEISLANEINSAKKMVIKKARIKNDIKLKEALFKRGFSRECIERVIKN